MAENGESISTEGARGQRPPEDFAELSRRILRYANRGLPRLEFVREVARMLGEFSECDAVELRFQVPAAGYRTYRWEADRPPEERFRYEIHGAGRKSQDGELLTGVVDSAIERLCNDILAGRVDLTRPYFTRNGSFWSGDVEDRDSFPVDAYGPAGIEPYKSLALIPFVIDDENVGLLQLKSRRRCYFSAAEIEFYENAAQMLGIAVADRRAQYALRERIKELSCLYGIAELAEQPGITEEGIFNGVVEMLPPAMQYPANAYGAIIFDGHTYMTPGFPADGPRLTAELNIGGENRGVVTVAYSGIPTPLEAGPFLPEEVNLLDAIARQVALLIERRRAAEERRRLEEQLRHADRLATLGQLAAGVAHELNEPLANILGFAQLAHKTPGLPKQTAQDCDRIVFAALHAREVVKKLLIFGRQMPTRAARVNINQIVAEGLYFLESRCAKEGIELIRDLDPAVPETVADGAQLHQMVVNLIVNAIQAMPEGGRLTLRTRVRQGQIELTVEDTGVGMSPELMRQIFLPFFTTKDVGQGTGLGLAVVHGIVNSHGGTVDVESTEGVGSRFIVTLPVRTEEEVLGL